MLINLGMRSRHPTPALFEEVMQAESPDAFARASFAFLTSAMPLHSVCISFNDLTSFDPRLVHDSLRKPAVEDEVQLTERYSVLNPTPIFLKERPGLDRSSFREQWKSLTPSLRDEYYLRYMRHEGWDKYAEVYCWSAKQLDACICVRRSLDQPNFSSSELKFLSNFRTLVAGCVRRLRRSCGERAISAALREVVLRNPVPLLILSWSLEPVCFNYEARRICFSWDASGTSLRILKQSVQPAVPAAVLQACVELKSEWLNPKERMRFEPAFKKVKNAFRPEFSAQVESLEVGADAGCRYFIVRFFEREGSVGDAESRRLRVLSCLSACERDVVDRLSEGLSNRDIARQLGKSQSTVKMQLHSAFKKLDVTNRTQLAALLR